MARPSTSGITLATVAAELGVSKATVSNAYNRPHKLSPALRARVLSTARDLGYPGPNPLAATLSRGQVGALGLVFDDPVSYAFTDPAELLFLQGVSEVAERTGTGLLIVPGGPDSRLVASSLVDGFICHTDLVDDERLRAVQDRGLPFVVVDGPAVPGHARVGVEDRQGAYRAAEHLLSLGHVRLAVVCPPLAPRRADGTAPPEVTDVEDARYLVARERLAGYRDAIVAAGLRWSDVVVVAPFDYPPRRAAHRAAMTLLAAPSGTRPTAVLAPGDELALGVLAAAQDLGLRVPDDVSVVGFDDTPAAQTARPALTTVAQPHQQKGRLAAQILLVEASGSGPSPSPQLLPVELKVRGSSGPPPSR